MLTILQIIGWAVCTLITEFMLVRLYTTLGDLKLIDYDAIQFILVVEGIALITTSISICLGCLCLHNKYRRIKCTINLSR